MTHTVGNSCNVFKHEKRSHKIHDLTRQDGNSHNIYENQRSVQTSHSEITHYYE